jgi:calcium-dependent protein kinase
MTLNYMHQNNIVHRDIKPENVLIEDLRSLQIKLTDFGFATFFNSENELDEVLGSPLYMPPEIVAHESYGSCVDIWSAGVMTYIMLCGRPPFFGNSKDDVYKSIQYDQLKMDSKEWDKISEDAKDFVQLCLNKDKDRRATSEQLINHAWLKDSVDGTSVGE